MAKKVKADIQVSGSGPMTTVYLFTPLTKRGARVLKAVVGDDAQWLGGSLAVEHRFARDLADGLTHNEGLVVV